MLQENLIPFKEETSNIHVGFRIFLVLLGTLFVGGLFSFLTSLIVNGNIEAILNEGDMNLKDQFWIQGGGFLGTLSVVFFFRRKVDLRSILSMGFKIKGKTKDLFWGFIIAAAIMTIGTLILLYTHNIEITAYHFDSSNFIYGFLLFIIVALNEEILCRGYILNNLMDSINPYWSLIITSVIFALMHGLNANLSWVGMINLFVAGILLGCTYIYTRNLWFPISLHLFWNFIQASVFDYNVSGLDVQSVFKFDMLIKDSFNGGDFGFEGSWLCTLLNVITIAFILYYYKKQNTPVIRKSQIISE